MSESEELRAAERSVAVTTHGRYLVRRPEGPGPFPLLVGFHGYAERAEDMLARLASLPGSEGRVLVAVQGLHAFYRVKTGEVVASWMTKQNRELAIADNVAYVARVVAEVRAEVPATSGLVFAGFSQGVAMAFRAAAFAGCGATGVIALAADVPPDVAERGLGALPPVLLARGESDPGYPPHQLEKDLATLRDGGVTVEGVEFAGGHEWNPAFSARAGEWLQGPTRFGRP
ncbi:MAG TPA: phospholipase [Thermoanaerobaculia bacterium]|nr:phospholipase [Thermoanaerobaculia bacterium]